MTTAIYNACVDRYSDMLMGYAYKICRDHGAAEDAVQEAYLRLWENRLKVEEKGVKSWLFTSVYRILIDAYRKNRRTDLPEFLPDTETGDDYGDFENRELLNTALQDLTPVQRSIVLLKDIEGYRYDEIASMLDLTLSQVKVYLFRARKKLKASLQSIEPELLRKNDNEAKKG